MTDEIRKYQSAVDIIMGDEIEYDRFALAKWSPMASEINRDEFLGFSFSHHMEILHKTKNIQVM